MRFRRYKTLYVLLAVCCLLLFAACGGNSAQSQKPSAAAPTSTPNAGQGEKLLAQSAQLLNTAQTLHGIFNSSISGQTTNGEVDSEIWRAALDKSRTLIQKSTLSQFSTGTLIVSNGKQLWQYDPTKHVVYTGNSTDASSTGTPVPGVSQGNGQQLILGVVEMIFTNSSATLVSSADTVNGQPVYTIAVTPRAQSSVPGGFNYDGTVSLDQKTHLPVALNLALTGIGKVQIAIPSLALNQPLATSLFTFTPPPGTRVQPLSARPGQATNSLTLAQAEQQAGYHLLSIPSSNKAYSLLSIDALGAPGNQIYALTYTLNGTSFTISEGKSLANLPLSGPTLNLRNTTATLSTSGTTNTLSWTEQSVGIQITGPLNKDQIVAVANVLT